MYRDRQFRATQGTGVSKTVAGSNSVIANGDMRSNANAATVNYENQMQQLRGLSDQTAEIDSRPARSWIAELATNTR